MEMLLAAALIVLIVSLGILNLQGLYEGERFVQAARRVESILRMARAEAATTGRRVRLDFDPATGRARVEWEPKPLEEPGNFVPKSAAWALDLPNDLVRFRQCRRVGESAVQVLTYRQDEELLSEDGEPLEAVTFYPDGSCDSAVIELAGRSEYEQRIARIELSGTSGRITMRILTPAEQQDQQQADQEAGL
ncbi:MAG: GspH/FimT family pseudopilin [Planctomycetes bacterium]|nr:GspH/FimT family pseudopilin [Planctomycetota bacterium]